MAERERKIFARQYQGPTDMRHSRGIPEVDEGILGLSDKEIGTVAVDSLFSSAMLNAKKRGSDHVTVLDIGSGDAGMYEEFLTIPWFANMSRRFLAQNPNFRLSLVGITDSPSVEEHNTLKEFRVKEEALDSRDRAVNEQVDVRNIYWSLTRTQPLSEVLDVNGIPVVDLAFATHSLRYVSPRVFKDTLDGVVDRLTVGGQFVCVGYSGTEPGFSSKRNDVFKSSPLSRQDQTPWKRLLRSSVNFGPDYLKEFAHLTDVELEAALRRAIGVYVRLGALNPEEVMKDLNLVDANPTGGLLTNADFFQAKANMLLLRGYNRLRDMRMSGAKLVKTDIINSLDPLAVKLKLDEPKDKFLLTKVA